MEMASEINPEFHSQFNDRYNLVTRKILRKLSEDSRSSISSIAAHTGISRKSVKDRIRTLEAEANLQYTLELSESALRLTSPHLIFVKFHSKPDYAHITELLSRSHIPQLAVTVKGTYDMFIYALATSAREYAYWDKGMQILLSDYSTYWRTSEVIHKQLGFFPLRNGMIERLDIDQKHKRLIEFLNRNSRASFSTISKALGMHFNTVAYNVGKLKQMGLVKRYTCTMEPRNASLMSFFAKYAPAHGYENRSAMARKAFMSDDDYSIVSRYAVTAALLGSYDFFTLGAFDDSKTAYKQDVLYHKRIFAKDMVRVEYGEVDKVLLGRLPLRSIDVGKEYNIVKWTTEELNHRMNGDAAKSQQR